MPRRRALPELADTPPTPAADALRRLETTVSPYTGIVRGVDEVLAAPADLRLPSLFCQTGHVEALVGPPVAQLGAGSARTRELARAAAVAEALERYSACDADAVEAVVAPANALGGRAVAPERFALFGARQYATPGFPYARFDADTPVAWVEGWPLPGGEPVLVPAQLVYLGWRRRPGEALVVHPTSSGLSCRATFAEAVASALFELLERDAFMIVWKARLSLPLLEWRGNRRLEEFERRFVRPTGLRVAAVDLSEVWDVPCVLGVARGRAAGEAPLGVGAAAAATVERAVEKALDEAIRVRSWAQALRAAEPAGASVPAPDAIAEFDEHVQYYAYDEHAAAADFLDASDERGDVSAVAPLAGARARALVEQLCARLAARGASAYAVDVTAPDVRAAGLRVARVLAPELCALDVEHAARQLGGRRLYEEPVRLGRRGGPLAEEDMNPDPHPFP